MVNPYNMKVLSYRCLHRPNKFPSIIKRVKEKGTSSFVNKIDLNESRVEYSLYLLKKLCLTLYIKECKTRNKRLISFSKIRLDGHLFVHCMINTEPKIRRPVIYDTCERCEENIRNCGVPWYHGENNMKHQEIDIREQWAVGDSFTSLTSLIELQKYKHKKVLVMTKEQREWLDELLVEDDKGITKFMFLDIIIKRRTEIIK